MQVKEEPKAELSGVFLVLGNMFAVCASFAETMAST